MRPTMRQTMGGTGLPMECGDDGYGARAVPLRKIRVTTQPSRRLAACNHPHLGGTKERKKERKEEDQ